MRVNRGREFVIAGYAVAGKTFDTIVFGYYDEGKLLYAGRTRNGSGPHQAEGFGCLVRSKYGDVIPAALCQAPLMLGQRFSTAHDARASAFERLRLRIATGGVADEIPRRRLAAMGPS